MDKKENGLVDPQKWEEVCSPMNTETQQFVADKRKKQVPGRNVDQVTRICCPDLNPNETSDFQAYWEIRKNN